MKKEIFKVLRCKCGKQSYETDPVSPAPLCPRCQQKMKYSLDWYIRVNGVDKNGKSKRHIQQVGRQQRQAESILRQAHTEIFQKKFFPEPTETETLLFSSAIQQVYDRKWKKKKDGARSLRRAEILVGLIGDIPLQEIDEKAYYNLISQLEERDVKDSTINRYRASLKTILRHHKQEYRFIQLDSEPEGRIRVLTKEEELEAIFLFQNTDHAAARVQTGPKFTKRSAKRDYYYEMPDLISVLIDTGLRANELLGLPPKDINFKTKLITVWRNKAEKPRSVPMTARVQKILEERAKRESGRLFNLDIHQADRAWKWVRKEMGLQDDTDFVIHALRHTCATRLIVKGIDIYRVQKWLGHKSIRTTEKYLHLDPGQLAAAAAALEPETRIETAKEMISHSLQVSPEQLVAIMQILQGSAPVLLA